MYIVISKPNRISVKSGLVHIVLASGVMIELLVYADAICIDSEIVCNNHAISSPELLTPLTAIYFNELPPRSAS